MLKDYDTPLTDVLNNITISVQIESQTYHYNKINLQLNTFSLIKNLNEVKTGQFYDTVPTQRDNIKYYQRMEILYYNQY